MTNDTEKNIGIKFVGSNRATETLTILPGTSTADVLQSLGLGAGYQLSSAANPDTVFRPNDALYAQVTDGEMMHVSSMVDAGHTGLAAERMIA